MAKISLKQFGRNLDRIGTCLDKNDWKAVPLKLGEALMKRRIFNDGKATNGSLIGQPPVAKGPLIGVYSRGHGKKRRSRGRQVGKKDLFLEGDLNRALTVGNDGKDLVLGLATAKARLIAQGQQDQTNKQIFKTSSDEASKIANSAAREIRRCIANNSKR